MEQETVPSIFDGIHDATAVRRKDMIPKWIRFFCWFFAVFCPVWLAFSLIIAVMQGTYNFSIYGLQGKGLLSAMSILSIASFIVKGTAAIGLLAEKNWAVKMAIVDGIIGIGLCVFSIIVYPLATYTNNGSFTSTHYNLRLELLLLIPYLIKMFKIRQDWEEDRYAHPQVAEVSELSK